MTRSGPIKCGVRNAEFRVAGRRGARGERSGSTAVVAQAFLPAGSRDFPVPCFLAVHLAPGIGDWKVAFTRRQECLGRHACVPVSRRSETLKPFACGAIKPAPTSVKIRQLLHQSFRPSLSFSFRIFQIVAAMARSNSHIMNRPPNTDPRSAAT